MNALAEKINQVESLRAQLASLDKELESDDGAKDIRKNAEALADKLAGVEGNLLQLKLTGRGQDTTRWAPMLIQKIAYLANQVVGSADFPPTTQQLAVAEELRKQGDQYTAQINDLLAKEVTAFNNMLREKNIPNIIAQAR